MLKRLFPPRPADKYRDRRTRLNLLFFGWIAGWFLVGILAEVIGLLDEWSTGKAFGLGGLLAHG